MSDFQPGNSVLHVYNPRFVGKVIEQKDGQIKVDWGENGVSIHPIRFVVDQSSHYEKLDGPSCIAVSGNSKSKSANARKKDAPTTYRTSEDDPAELAINLSRGDTLENESTDIFEEESTQERTEADQVTEELEEVHGD